jgi:hypothetical protein
VNREFEELGVKESVGNPARSALDFAWVGQDTRADVPAKRLVGVAMQDEIVLTLEGPAFRRVREMGEGHRATAQS